MVSRTLYVRFQGGDGGRSCDAVGFAVGAAAASRACNTRADKCCVVPFVTIRCSGQRLLQNNTTQGSCSDAPGRIVSCS